MKILDKNRATYREKINKIKKCEFCNTKNIKEQECKSLSGKYWMVLVNKYPYMDGNLMIIPKRHLKHIAQVKKEEWSELQEIFIKTKNKLSKLFKTKSFNIGLNIGKNAGCSIEHLHWQVIPRKNKIQNAANIFADIQIITTSPQDLKKLIEE